MNGLPSDADLSPLSGRVLEQVRIASHQMQLILGDAHSISVEGTLTLVLAGEEAELIDEHAGSATSVCRLLGSRIRHAVRTETGGLRLSMGNASVLELHVDRQEFESFQVHLGATTLIA